MEGMLLIPEFDHFFFILAAEGAGVCGIAAEIMARYKHRPIVLSYGLHDGHPNQGGSLAAAA